MQPKAPIPKTLRIGPFNYKIDTTKQAIEAFERDISSRLYGAQHSGRLILAIRPGMPREVEQETLTHEMLHSLFSLAGLLDDNEDAEEDIINRLAPLLLGAIKQNPQLVKYLCD